MTFSALDSQILGPLFCTDEMRAVFSDEARLMGFLRAEQALATAEAEHGLVPSELGGAIAALSAGDFDLKTLAQGTALAGMPIIPFVSALQAALPANLRGFVHRGATTQDIVDTGLVLQMRDAFALLEADLDAILAALIALAKRHATTPCAGRTYGQHAAPVTFGFKAAVWLAGIASAAGDLPRLKDRVLIASLGGPVGTLASLGEKGPPVAEAFARHLRLREAPIAWHAIRSSMAHTAAWLCLLLGSLGKMAGDIVQLAGTDVGEVAEAHEPGRGGSSAMPHKRNPVSATVIIAAQSAAKGHLVTLNDAMMAAQERSPGLWHAEWHALPPLFGLASGALAHAKTLAQKLEVHPDRMLSNLQMTKGLLFAEAVSASLAVSLGRAEAHALVEEAADIVRDTGEPLQTVLQSAPFLSRTEGASVEEAFSLQPHIMAAEIWVQRAVDFAEAVRSEIRPQPPA
jgi:3-carboxy-cis,cis-muconate cycloisomerase